jgi:hypothetical protein
VRQAHAGFRVMPRARAVRSPVRLHVGHPLQRRSPVHPRRERTNQTADPAHGYSSPRATEEGLCAKLAHVATRKKFTPLYTGSVPTRNPQKWGSHPARRARASCLLPPAPALPNFDDAVDVSIRHCPVAADPCFSTTQMPRTPPVPATREAIDAWPESL